MSETALVNKIRKALKARGVKTQKNHGSPHLEAGTPDLCGCLPLTHSTMPGRGFWLEVKLPGKEATPLQHKRLQEWRNTGALTEVVRSVDEVLEVLEL